MAIHPNFPTSPHEILKPEYRWFPADEVLRESSYEKLLPPFVHKIRKEVEQWRNKDYEGATHTSRALLLWWFKNQHIITKVDGTLVEFKYYFAQREAIETVIYLYEVARVKDKYDLIRYDSSGAVSTGMFDEEWLRLVIKMATGSGKTKVMSLIVTWCYFHKLYEDDSQLASNFLIIAPNIIVLDRLRTDFDGLRIFFSDWGSLSDNELEAIASGPTIGPPGSNRAQEIAKSILDEKKAEYMAELAKYNAKIRAKKRAKQQGDMEGEGSGSGKCRNIPDTWAIRRGRSWCCRSDSVYRLGWNCRQSCLMWFSVIDMYSADSKTSSIVSAYPACAIANALARLCVCAPAIYAGAATERAINGLPHSESVRLPCFKFHL